MAVDKQAFHALVSGQVQGVFYRASTVAMAKQLGLGGWVRNLGDGRVELLASGDSAQLTLLQKWLWQGPPAAKVTDVVITPMAYETFSDFTQK